MPLLPFGFPQGELRDTKKPASIACGLLKFMEASLTYDRRWAAMLGAAAAQEAEHSEGTEQGSARLRDE